MAVLPDAVGLTCARARMRRALQVAAQTPAGDVPVGAVIYGPDGRELATGTNRREADLDPTAHAEVVAIRAAVTAHGDSWRLSDCTLVVTLEPCTMCAGAIVGARVGTLIFGAWEPKTGACGSLFDVVRDPAVLHRPQVRAGVLEEECQRLLTDFFRPLRGPADPGTVEDITDATLDEKESIMADLSDRAKNKGQDLGGKTKEAAGEVTGNEKLENEGRADQAKADIKDKLADAGDKVKEKGDQVLGALKRDDK